VHAGIVGKIAGRLTGVKHMITTRHYGYSVKERHFLYRLENTLTSRCDVVIAVSDAVQKYILSRGIIDAKKIVVIHNGIDQAEFDNVHLSIGQNKTPAIGSVGRLHPIKGFDTLIKCFKIVLYELPSMRLEIIGDGPEKDRLLHLIETMGLHDSVLLHGRVPHDRVLSIMSNWDLLVHPAKWEGFGLVLIEAMALGIAVVATRVGGVEEIIQDGVNGFLVQSDNPEKMAEKIVWLLKNNALRKKIGLRGKERALQSFTITSSVERLDRVYQELTS
jgi:glycosyltransferase involved in cell wall biosynthesis